MNVRAAHAGGTHNDKEEDMERNAKVVLVTGGASGIGLAVAHGLLGEGWKVVAADVAARNIEAARAALPHERARCVHMDVTDEAAVAAVLEEIDDGFGVLAGLVNCAGIGRDVPFLETDAALLRQTLEVNLVGTFIVARESARRMRLRGQGSIVNITSVSGIRGNLGRAAYGASKGGVITLTQVMAVELAEYGIRVNAVAPGPVDTPLVSRMHTPEARERWLQHVPQKRYAQPDELCGPIAWLLDDRRSGFVTGQVVSVDGGFTAGGLVRP
ncbi:SDR family NAD(P)-dependent oxidoreductase [Bordetella flabilis]|nr:SDR family NAD(P)-dependent oxidoreductase [Bordetella flabilis]